MPERSFGRTVRYRRTKLGLSQAKLGELVGRSANTIRSWERDSSTPTDPSVLFALAAVLDLDEQALFEKAGMELPALESAPTVEEALASLAPTVQVDSREQDDTEPETTLDPDSALDAEAAETVEEGGADQGDEEPESGFEPFPTEAERESRAVTMSQEPSFVAPPEPYQILPASPPVSEPSYLEDTEQRQLYRVRNLATVVLTVALVVVFLWSLGNTIEALGNWWDEFVATLRL